MSQYLIIGYGNTLRGDDGVGVRVAETIATQQWPAVQVLAVHQLTPELAENIASAKGVIFVDAVPSDAATVEVQPLQPIEIEETLGHTGDPRAILSLVKVLYGCCPAAWWVLIPGRNFEFGEELSPVTEKCLQEAISIIKKFTIN
ncbi:hydrogenase maturation protease [Gloeothece verrucosa]|uniref:Hydrogenase maturation protease n=1 Tax=Gloeothece verrucosa (strain PCC 7822) TaxID=497965 RepID=E0UJL6_GLOV7|nr:hydrogenase maturation protease [Gloeothece verrucosa]ADN12260.1 hydrogenase maturation protease [Gloeothece verrucosa PCC 7822]